MRLFRGYVRVRFLQAGRCFLTIFLTTLVLAVSFALLMWLQIGMADSDASLTRVSLGVVGDYENTVLGIGIAALEEYDTSRFTVEFKREDDEVAARDDLLSGRVSAYIVIPDEFLDSLFTGENTPVTLVTDASKTGLGAQLMREFAQVISDMIADTQTGVYSMEQIYLDNEITGDELWDAVQDMDLTYLLQVLSRENFYSIETVDGVRSISAAQSMACSIVVLFALLWGMNGAALLVRSDYSFERLLLSRGVLPWMQVVGEFAAFFCLLAASGAGILVIAYAVCGVAGILPYDVVGVAPLFWVRALPVVLCMAALLYLFYAISESLTGGLLCNFIGALVLGYLSGCFYPISYFPKVIRIMAHVLPTGIGMEYLRDVILQDGGRISAWLLVGYSLLFLLCSVAIRSKKIKAG